MADAPALNPDPVETDLWADEYGNARVLAVRAGYSMMRRRNANPFVISNKRLCDPNAGWRLVERSAKA